MQSVSDADVRKRLLEQRRFELAAKGVFRLGRCYIFWQGIPGLRASSWESTATDGWSLDRWHQNVPVERCDRLPGRLRTSDRSMWHRKAWWAGVSSGSLVATCPKIRLRRRTIGSSTGQRCTRTEYRILTQERNILWIVILRFRSNIVYDACNWLVVKLWGWKVNVRVTWSRSWVYGNLARRVNSSLLTSERHFTK